MTTKAGAFHAWIEDFGMPAYSSACVPTNARLPYITYEFSSGMFGEQQHAIVVNVWYGENASESEVNDKAEEIGRALGLGGVRLACEGGMVWLMRGEPFSQTVSDTAGLHRRYINITAEFLTIE